MTNEKKRRDHMIRGNRKKLSSNDIIQENIVDDTPAEAINNDGERVFVPKTPKSGKSKLDKFMESMHPQYEYHPHCDTKIEFETLPIVAAVKKIGDAVVDYRKDTRPIRERVSQSSSESEDKIFPWDNPQYIDKWVTTKESVVLGWKYEFSDKIENAWNYYHPTDKREDSYCLGCLNKQGKLIVDFKYCIIEVVGRYIFAGYDGDYRYGKYQGLYDLYTAEGEYLFGGFTQYHLFQEESVLACNWGGTWYDSSHEGSPYFVFDSHSGYWSLFDLSIKRRH